MRMLLEILTFNKMVSPAVLQILFWAGIAGTFYGVSVLIELGNWAWPLALVFGPLAVRVIFERAILAFRTFDKLTDIHSELVEFNGRDDSTPT